MDGRSSGGNWKSLSKKIDNKKNMRNNIRMAALVVGREATLGASYGDTNSEHRVEEAAENGNIKDVKKPDFVPVNKTFRKVQVLLLAKEKAMKHWDMKDSTFSDKIRNIHVTEGRCIQNHCQAKPNPSSALLPALVSLNST